MAYKITDDCMKCEACEELCPDQAIMTGTGFTIDPNKCTECVGDFESPKCVEVCPVDACVPDPRHKESRQQLLAKWKKLHPGKTPAVT